MFYFLSLFVGLSAYGCVYSNTTAHEELFHGLKFASPLFQENLQKNLTLFQSLDPQLQKLIRAARLQSNSTVYFQPKPSTEDILSYVDFITVNKVNIDSLDENRKFWEVIIGVGGGNKATLVLEKLKGAFYRMFESFDGDPVYCDQKENS